VDLPCERLSASARSRVRIGWARLPGASSAPVGLTMMESRLDKVSAGRTGSASARAVAPAPAMKVRRSNWPVNSFIAIFVSGHWDPLPELVIGHYIEGHWTILSSELQSGKPYI
jgi:hypothetical protein